MANRLIVLFVEGETDEEFYNKLVSHLRQKKGGFPSGCKVRVKPVKGINKFNEVLRLFEKNIKIQYPDYIYHIFLCHDTDVFEFAQKPGVNFEKVKKELKGKGAKSVECVKAKRCIEDWFFYDPDGLRSYLNLREDFELKKYHGSEGLKNLFNKAGKVYSKGRKCKGFAESLNMEIICHRICPEIKCVCKSIGINCTESDRLCIKK